MRYFVQQIPMPHPKKVSELLIEKIYKEKSEIHNFIAEFSLDGGRKFWLLSTSRLQHGFGAIVTYDGKKVTLHTRIEIARHRGNASLQSEENFAYHVDWPLQAIVFNMHYRPWRVVDKISVQYDPVNLRGHAKFISADGHQEVDIEIVRSG